MYEKISEPDTLNMIGLKNHKELKMTAKNKYPFLHQLSRIMDSRFEILGIKFGLDFLIGLIPILGNSITTLISIISVIYCAFQKVSPFVILRMLLNIGFDFILTSIPILGNFADIFWRAHKKNYDLLDQYSQNPDQVIRQSWIIFALIGLMILSFISLCIYFIYWLISFL